MIYRPPTSFSINSSIITAPLSIQFKLPSATFTNYFGTFSMTNQHVYVSYVSCTENSAISHNHNGLALDVADDGQYEQIQPIHQGNGHIYMSVSRTGFCLCFSDASGLNGWPRGQIGLLIIIMGKRECVVYMWLVYLLWEQDGESLVDLLDSLCLQKRIIILLILSLIPS